mmetsp:Transcript_15823/g.20657  ORF Transcript_15823/g.20657 Transcript_15823/m.20657 type:complete len:498 (+) Transcript_15823:131-1624(+)|eukprot:CAMPEP_0198145124 /NCGR_PEP_ID=MMETSP1443-20131203/21057_1 /TAXON_ID=186043 /ORGANISM="Entomoneis sp., Strain CCMP2396" /LENGTH=497 /DNA_ID=CAMNT_0043808655 /DNA_START=85 /DNA_END=1578 /DNA_ORIENTATION=+
MSSTADGNGDAPKPVYHFMVVVLGDLGRSPRMQYHVLSLLQAGHFVTFVGYRGEALITPLQKFTPDGGKMEPTLSVLRFPAPNIPFLKPTVPFLHFLWRTISLWVLLLVTLTFIKPATVQSKKVLPQAILMQNPPAIPVLLVMVLYKMITGAKLIIDWHNLGYSMINEKYTTYRELGRMYEHFLAPLADGHFTVTKALQDFLKNDLGVKNENCSVLYDCPPSIFRMRTLSEQHQILTKQHTHLMRALKDSGVTHWPELTQNPSLEDSNSTLLTEPLTGRPGRFQSRAQRPAFIVSSTSWTRDEDMSVLIDALQLADKHIQETKSSLRIVCAITGKGHLKEFYKKEIAKKTWKSVVVTTLWMEPEDYPTFLATADVGISLHTSTSGLDLPIKILDYFGCEVPVCAHRFSCLDELVQDDVNGRTFEKPDELSNILLELLEPLESAKPNQRFGNHSFGALERYSTQIQGQLLWSENWPTNAWPVLEKALQEEESFKSKSD